MFSSIEPYYQCTYYNNSWCCEIRSRKKYVWWGVSIEESFQAQIIEELSLFWWLSIPSSTCADALAWWCIHEGQFFNVCFFAKQILEIPSSQKEIEWMFSLVRVLIAQRWCHLQVEKHGPNHYYGEELTWWHGCQLQTKVKLEAILENGKKIGRGELWVDSRT
jgi:hypothetical protein